MYEYYARSRIVDLEGSGPPPTAGTDIPGPGGCTFELPVCPAGTATLPVPCGEGGVQAGVRFAEAGIKVLGTN